VGCTIDYSNGPVALAIPVVAEVIDIDFVVNVVYRDIERKVADWNLRG
jgi:hypothetical protein